MANRSRDLSISILSDVDQFDTSRPADELERLGDAAKEAGDSFDKASDDVDKYARDTERSLERVGDAAKDSSRETEQALKDSDNDLNRFAQEADSTARKVDDAFDKIARSSRSNTRKVDDDFDRAKRGMDDFKDEAQSTGREAAASFSGGFDDITDTVQEIAANAFGGFGPAGMAAGLAAAAGIGILVSQLEKGKEEANEAKEAMVGLARSIIDAGGDIRDVDLGAVVAGWSDEIADEAKFWELWQKNNITNFEQVQKAAAETGIEITDMLGAMSGADAQAGQRVLSQINDLIEEERDLLEESGRLRYEQDGSIDAVTQGHLKEIDALEHKRDVVMEALGLTEESIQRAKDYEEAIAPIIEQEERDAAAAEKAKEAQERLTQAREDATDILQSFGEVGDAYTEAQAENSDSQVASIEQVIEAQEKQIAAQRDWADNMETLYKRGVEEGALEQLARLGPEGAPLVAALAEASDAELEKWAGNTEKLGAQGTDGFIASLLDGQPGAETAGSTLGQSAADGFSSKRSAMESAARGVRRAAQSVLDDPLEVDVVVKQPSAAGLWSIRSSIQSGIGTITVPVAAGTLRASRTRS